MTTKQVQDQFEQYFSEKLWSMLPAFVRNDDLSSENPGVLKALVDLMAEQAAVLRRSHDRLWEDFTIETCDDWVVPYLAQLVATRLLSSNNPRGRRIDVAKTIYYRRRKGTPRVLEELIFDIAGWEGKMVEAYRKLGRFRHNLDAISPRGRWSKTPQGGTADLRNPLTASFANGPFDEYAHTPDIRRHRGQAGRYNLSKLQFFLYRIPAYRTTGVTPFHHTTTDTVHFSFDPSGRDIPLFMPRQRPSNWDDWTSAQIWELPGPMPCQLLAHDTYEFTEAGITLLEGQPSTLSSQAASALRTLIGQVFPNSARLIQVLQSFQIAELNDPLTQRSIRVNALSKDCGKYKLWNNAIQLLGITSSGNPSVTIDPVDITVASLATWLPPASAPGTSWVIDPVLGRIQFFPQNPQVLDLSSFNTMYHYGSAGKVGAGAYSRLYVESSTPSTMVQGGASALQAGSWSAQSTVQIEDSLTYQGIANLTSVDTFTLQAANPERPYIRLQNEWSIQSSGTGQPTLVLDGLWLGSEGAYQVTLKGNFDRVVLRRCTFDPGGGLDITGSTIHPVPLHIEGKIETLEIDHSIMGSIQLVQGVGHVETLVVKDSIIDAIDSIQTAVQLPTSEATFSRTTVFGTTKVHQINASEAIFTGSVSVNNHQQGCFRFSTAPYTSSKLPHKYRSFDLFETASTFVSRSFGQPGYAQLSQHAPQHMQTGAENGSSMGAFSENMEAPRLNDLQRKVEEYMPFGLAPLFLKET